MYDYKAMSVFATVVEQGAMQAAAEKLSMTPSAVTQTIQKLEKQLKIKLLHRTTRKLSLTDAGNVFYQHIAQIQNHAENAIRSIESLRSEPVGELNIACISGLIDSFLIKSFKTILDNYPEFHLNITFEDAHIDLATQKIDILLRSGNIADERTIARHLYNFDWAIVAHRSYVEQHGCPKNLAELEQLDWIGYPSKNAKKEPLILRRGREIATLNPYFRIHCNSLNAAKGLILNGLGISKLPTKYIQKQLESGELVALCADWALPQTPLYLVTLQRIQSEKVRVASQLILDYFKNLP